VHELRPPYAYAARAVRRDDERAPFAILLEFSPLLLSMPSRFRRAAKRTTMLMRKHVCCRSHARKTRIEIYAAVT